MKIVVAPILALALAAATYANVQVDAAVAADKCDIPAKTLVFDKCGKSCSESAACMSSASCKVECIEESYITRTKTQKQEFWFLVQYGKWKSDQEKANEKWLPGSKSDNNIACGRRSNDDLTAIGTVKLPPVANAFVVRGGGSDYESTKSRVANVEFESDFLAGNEHVTTVKLENLNLAKSADKLLEKFPSKVQIVSFSNGLLTEVPPSISRLKALQELDLSYNYITKISSSLKTANLTKLDLRNNNFTEVPTALSTVTELNLNNNTIKSVSDSSSREGLTKLELRGNKLSKFEASYKDITHLDLSLNELTEVPEVIEKFKKLETLILSGNKITKLSPVLFKLPKLQTLHVSENPMKDLTLTKAQAEVFKNLKFLIIDYEDVKTGCSAGQEVKVGFTKFCISETGSSKTKGIHVRQHHHHHHHRHHQNAEGETTAQVAEIAAAVATGEKTAEKEEAPLQEVSTLLSAINTAKEDAVASGKSSAADNELVIALSSAAGGFMAVVVAILAVAINKKRRAASATTAEAAADAATTEVDEEQKTEAKSSDTADSASL